MAKYSIEKKDFDKQKKELKKFADQPATSTELDEFKTDGQLSDFLSGGLPGFLSGHKVTGKEMNNLVTKLQSCFAEINERDRKVIKEFGQVYETFEALDKGYIQGILIGVESAKHASEEAKAAQKDADDAIKALQKTISKLKQFKDEINRHKHLKDVDEMWSDVHRIDGRIEEFSERIDAQEPQIEALSTKIDDAIGGIQDHIHELTEYKDNLEKLEHISDIDSLWTDVDSLKKTTSGLSESFEIKTKDLEKGLSDIQTFRKSQKHFDSIDDMWDRLQSSEKKIQKCIDDFSSLSDTFAFLEALKDMTHINDVDEEWDYSHSLGKEVETLSGKASDVENNVAGLKYTIANLDKENIELKNKIKIAFAVAGGALGLSVLQLILSVMGIL